MYKEIVIRICVGHKSNALASEIKLNIWNTFYIINHSTAHTLSLNITDVNEQNYSL